MSVSQQPATGGGDSGDRPDFPLSDTPYRTPPIGHPLLDLPDRVARGTNGIATVNITDDDDPIGPSVGPTRLQSEDPGLPLWMWIAIIIPLIPVILQGINLTRRMLRRRRLNRGQ